jgi:hypothetical protein
VALAAAGRAAARAVQTVDEETHSCAMKVAREGFRERTARYL